MAEPNDPPLVNLFTMSDEELEQRLRDTAPRTDLWFNDYLKERVRRGQDKQARRLMVLTVVATIAAIFSVVTSVIQVALALR